MKKKTHLSQSEIDILFPIVQMIRAYHNHSVVGMQHIPKSGPILLVSNHSLATYDLLMIYGAIYEETGRYTRPLMDRAFTRVPIIAELLEKMGAKVGSQKNAQKLLRAGELVAVAPGGMREALRPSTEKYQIRWENRYGFVRLAIDTQVPIVLAACPHADDLYEVFESPLTQWVYDNLRLPLVFAKGLGYSFLPKPVPLVHLLSKPILPPPRKSDPEENERQVKAFHKKLCTKMNALLGEAVKIKNKVKG